MFYVQWFRPAPAGVCSRRVVWDCVRKKNDKEKVSFNLNIIRVKFY
jgi:hypothetical protein